MICTWKGKEIQNPVIKVVVFVGISCIFIATTPVWAPIDFILKQCGRKGFVRHLPNGDTKIKFERDAFKKE